MSTAEQQYRRGPASARNRGASTTIVVREYPDGDFWVENGPHRERATSVIDVIALVTRMIWRFHRRARRELDAA